MLLGEVESPGIDRDLVRNRTDIVMEFGGDSDGASTCIRARCLRRE